MSNARDTELLEAINVQNVATTDLLTTIATTGALNVQAIVIDNFDSTSSVDALSAGKGKEVNDLVSTINVEMEERTTYGVVSGLVVAQQTVAGMTVKCSAGIIYMAGGTRFAPLAVASIEVTAADATNPRKDIVYVASTGVITYLAGTAGATPSAPATPAGGMLLAEIDVAIGQTTIVTANIQLRRKRMWSEDWITKVTLINSWVSSAPGIRISKDSAGRVWLEGLLQAGAKGSVAFVIPVGYRPVETKNFATYSNGTAVASKISVSYNGNVSVLEYTINAGLNGISYTLD